MSGTGGSVRNALPPVSGVGRSGTSVHRPPVTESNYRRHEVHLHVQCIARVDGTCALRNALHAQLCLVLMFT